MQNIQCNLRNLPEHELVARAQRNDTLAFAALIEKNYSACHKLALTILRDIDDAEDEVQNAFWKAFEHIGQFQQGSKFSTWLTRILVNQCLMRLRHNRRAQMVYLDATAAEGAVPIEIVSHHATPEQIFGNAEVAGVLRNEVGKIPPLLRHVFVLRDVHELPIDDVAGRLGITVAAAKSRLLRARVELKSRLRKHCGRRLGPATLFA